MHSKIVPVFVLFVGSVVGHSWLQCSDYRPTTTADVDVFNINKCVAWPRGWKNNNDPVTFGADNGYNYGTNTLGCSQPYTSDLGSYYSTAYPMAQYAPGQNVCMAWPTKNHVAASCNNPNIPDNGLYIYMTGANPTANPSSANTHLVYSFTKNTKADEYAGFQHCPNFCSNQDKATCTGCFTIPTDVTVGATYTFLWNWNFNSPTDMYNNCFDAMIVGSPVVGPTYNANPTSNTPIYNPTSNNPTSNPTSNNPTSSPTSNNNPTTSTMYASPTSQQVPATSQQQVSKPDQDGCISQCMALCGDRGVATCDCSNGFSASCLEEDTGDASSIAASMALLATCAAVLTIY